MAKTDLARLVVSLEAQNTQMLRQLEQSEKRAAKWERQVSKSVSKVSAVFKSLLVGGAAIAGFVKVAKATMESEQAISKLETKLKSTGGAVGFTSDQLQGFASQLQKTSTFGDEAIMGLEARLLSFGNVTGDTFKKATQASLDLAASLGKDLNSSAMLVGRALNDPIKGLTMLTRSGVAFTQAQGDMVNAMVEAGDIAGAQTIIMAQLEKQFGGAAQAARNTFGGALTALQEAFGDLLEAPGGMADSTKALNEFTELLQDPGTKQAAETLTSSLVTGFGLVTNAIVGSFNALTQFGEKLRSAQWFREGIDYLGMRANENAAGIREAFTGENSGNSGTITAADRAAAWGTKATPSAPAPGKPEAMYRPNAAALAGGGTSQAKYSGPGKKGTSYVDEIMRQSDALWRDFEDKMRDQQALVEQVEGIKLSLLSDEQRAVVELQAKYIELQNAVKAGAISQEEAIKVSAQLAEQWATQQEAAVAKTSEMSEFAKAAAQNMQSAFADFLFDPFSGSLQDMAMDFVNVLRRMAAEAVAAKIFESILGAAGGASGGGGWVSALVSTFAGAKDGGGSIGAGQWGIAGENGPEIVSGPAMVTSRMDTSRIFGEQSNANSGSNVRIVNAIDPKFISDYLASPEGDQVFLNLAGRNARKMRQISAGA